MHEQLILSKSEGYLGPCLAFMMEIFAKIVTVVNYFCKLAPAYIFDCSATSRHFLGMPFSYREWMAYWYLEYLMVGIEGPKIMDMWCTEGKILVSLENIFVSKYSQDLVFVSQYS